MDSDISKCQYILWKIHCKTATGNQRSHERQISGKDAGTINTFETPKGPSDFDFKK